VETATAEARSSDLMAEEGPKSAYELAMERLRKKDAEEGVSHKPLTDAQKAAIAEVRSQYEAKLADLEIRHEPVVRAAAVDPEGVADLEKQYRAERQRLIEERDRKIEKIREEN
jgi:hypothetical protein